MSQRVKYIGPFDGVELEVAPKLWQTVESGGVVEVGDELAASLLAQSDNWSKASGVKKSEKEGS